MGKFTTSFTNSRIEEWKEKYFNYNSLTTFIKTQSNLLKNPQPLNSNTQTSEERQFPLNRTELIQTFVKEVDKELKGVYVYFLNRERELYKSINTRLHFQKNYYSIESNGFIQEFNQLIQVSIQALNLTNFVCDNIHALDRILKKFDKHFKCLQTNIYNDYIVAKFQIKESDLLYLFHFKLVDEVSALLVELQKELICSFKLSTNNDSIIKESIDFSQNEQQTYLIGNNEVSQNENYSNQPVPLQAIQHKYNTILSNVEEIERRYQDIQKVNRSWIRLFKLKEYSDGTKVQKINSSIEIEEDSGLMNTDLLSKANKRNVFLTILQKFYMAASATFIIPNLNNALFIDFNEKESFRFLSGLILSCTAIGGMISLFITKYIIGKSYKIPMVTSCIFSVIGNLLYSFSFGTVDTNISYRLRLLLFCISRILIGMALNNLVHRKYLNDFIPKRKISNFMLVFKLFSLIGNAIGPIITLIFSFFNYPKGSGFQFDSYDVPSWFFSIGAIIMFILIVTLYKEPISPSFNAYSEGNAPSEHATSRRGSFDIGASFTEQDNKEILNIEQQLSKINDANQFTDTNLVQHCITNIITREKAPSNTISKALNFVLLNVFICNYITSSLLVITPIFLNILSPPKQTLQEVDKEVCYLIGMTLFAFVGVYFFNFFYVSVKLDKRCYLIFITCLLFSVECFLLVTFKEIGHYVLVFVFVILLGYLFEDTTIYFYTKMVPTDFTKCSIASTSIVQFMSYFGMFIGNLSSVWGYFDHKDISKINSCFNLIILSHLVLLVLSFVYLIVCINTFKERPIRRIIRNKDRRKLRRTEF